MRDSTARRRRKQALDAAPEAPQRLYKNLRFSAVHAGPQPHHCWFERAPRLLDLLPRVRIRPVDSETACARNRTRETVHRHRDLADLLLHL